MMHDPPPGGLGDVFEDDFAPEDERTPMTRTLLMIAGTVLLVGVVVAVVLIVSIAQRATETESGEIDLAGLPMLTLRAATADVTVVEGVGDTLSYTADVTSGLFATDFELRRGRSGVEVVSDCLSLLNPGCGVELTVTVPKGLPVEVLGGHGDVAASGLSAGVLTVRTASGDVQVGDLSVDELQVDTTSGDVEASFARQPYAAKATTRDGDVELALPQGEREYTVDAASSDGGSVENALGHDGAAADTRDGSFIRVRTSSGDVVISRE